MLPFHPEIYRLFEEIDRSDNRNSLLELQRQAIHLHTSKVGQDFPGICLALSIWAELRADALESQNPPSFIDEYKKGLLADYPELGLLPK